MRARVTCQLAGLGGQLEDSTEIWERRREWRRFIRELSDLNETLTRWHTGLLDLKGLDLGRLLPCVDAFGTEIESRLAAIKAMLCRQPLAQPPRVVELHADRDVLRGFSHSQRAAALLCRDLLARIDRLTLALFETASGISGIPDTRRRRERDISASSPFIADVDRLAATLRQSAVLWLTLLLAIYVPAFPNVVATVALANAFTMGFAIVPFVQARVLLVPSILGEAFAGSLYMLVMPQLSGFAGLGALIFIATFVIGYVFRRPQAFAARAMGLAMLVIVINAENEQTYNFLFFANWLIAAAFFVLAMIVGWRFPISFRPEVRFLAILNRFFRSACILLSDVEPEAGLKSSWRRWRRAFRIHEITVLPKRLQAWSTMLPPDALCKDGRDHLQSFLHSLQEMSDRIRELLHAESDTASRAPAIELRELKRAWQASVQEVLGELSRVPRKTAPAVSRTQLQDALIRLNARIESALDRIGAKGMSVEEGEIIYRILGACRGTSVALMELKERMLPIDWTRLREARS